MATVSVTLKERYLELISLTQLYLKREYESQDVCLASPTLFPYFQKKVKVQPTKVPQPSVTRSPPQDKIVHTSAPLSPEPVKVSPQPILSTTIPAPESKPEMPQKTKSLSTAKTIHLEPLAAPPSYVMDHSIKEFVTSKYPKNPIYETLPDDAIARKIKNVWQKESIIPPIIILTFQQDAQQLAFLKNIAAAITLRLAPTRILSGLKIESEKKWDKLIESPGINLIIACDYGFFLQPGLKNLFKEDSKQGKHFLGSIPLLLLSDINLYLQQPQLKTLLWQAICKESGHRT